MECDVLVIGAGVMGLSSAHHLKRLNPEKRVVLIERLGAPGRARMRCGKPNQKINHNLNIN